MLTWTPERDADRAGHAPGRAHFMTELWAIEMFKQPTYKVVYWKKLIRLQIQELRVSKFFEECP